MTNERIKELLALVRLDMPFTGDYHTYTSRVVEMIRTVVDEASEETMLIACKKWKKVEEEVRKVKRRLFRLSDLHDNMDHWMRMQEMNSDLQDKVIEPLYAFCKETENAKEVKL